MIEVTHNGHKITYAENQDVWCCYLMDVEGKTLSAIKAKLNKLDAEARRCNVPVIVVQEYGTGVRAVGVATLIDGGQVWVTYKSNKDTRREKMSMATVVLDTVESRELIRAARAKRDQADILGKEAREMFAAIPRVTADDLKALTPKPDTLIE